MANRIRVTHPSESIGTPDRKPKRPAPGPLKVLNRIRDTKDTKSPIPRD